MKYQNDMCTSVMFLKYKLIKSNVNIIKEVEILFDCELDVIEKLIYFSYFLLSLYTNGTTIEYNIF